MVLVDFGSSMVLGSNTPFLFEGRRKPSLGKSSCRTGVPKGSVVGILFNAFDDELLIDAVGRYDVLFDDHSGSFDPCVRSGLGT